MNYHFSRHGLEGREKSLHRLFEILVGGTSWALLLGMLFLSFWKPLVAAVFIIAFDLYWLLRLFYMTILLVLATLRLSLEKEADWMAQVRGIDDLSGTLAKMQRAGEGAPFKRKFTAWVHRKELEALEKSGSPPPASKEIYHLVLFPLLQETREIVEPGVQSLLSQWFPSKQILVVLAVEERASAEVQRGAGEIQKKYRDELLDFLVLFHPDGLPGEARVKGANASFAAREAAKYFEARQIPFENVIVSCFDADTVVSPDYFSCLTYYFMVCPARNRASFQPIPVYHNNIWEAPGFSRVLDIGSSFFQMIEATNPDRLVTFSSHSMSFKALVEVGCWPVDMISDDSAIFWKAFIHYDGDYRVVPLPVTLSMDVVHAGTWWRTVVNVYRQKRRWAWGAENFPLVMRAFLKSDRIPLKVRMSHALKLFDNHVSWATWGFLLTVIGWFPAVFSGREFSNSVLYYSSPRITSTIFNLSFVALFTTVILGLSLLPKKKVKRSLLKRLGLAMEWLLVPFVFTFLSALPALDAQTRLMFGRHMEFWATEKKRNLVR